MNILKDNSQSNEAMLTFNEIVIKIIHSSIALLLVIHLAGCKKTNDVIITLPPPSVIVYATGIQDSMGFVNLKYWKNGVSVTLPNHNFRNPDLSTSGIAVLGNDVFISGNDINSTTNRSMATCWINEIPTAQTLSDASMDSYANAIAVSGNNIYVAGSEHYFNGMNAFAVYWVNGNPIFLGDSSKQSNATSIALSGNDVYIAGSEYDGTHYVALYWKNGNPVILSDSSMDAFANSILVSGNDVYVTGSTNNGKVSIAEYWKNGKPTIIKSSSTLGEEAGSIAVLGDDVYIITSEVTFYSSATFLWKNGVQIPNYGASDDGYSSVVAFGNDIYVAGASGATSPSGIYFPTYWKNGNPVKFTDREASIISFCFSNP